MERVETLGNKLQELIRQRAPVDQILLTVQMIQSELQHLQLLNPGVDTPVAIQVAPHTTAPTINLPKKSEEKIVEVLQVDEAAVEAELEEIKRNAESKNKISVQNRPQMFFDPVEDTPTLTHQKPTEPERKKEVHESIASGNSASLNDALKQSRLELSDSLKEMPVRDLKKAIGVNDRFLFIKELFRGDE